MQLQTKLSARQHFSLDPLREQDAGYPRPGAHGPADCSSFSATSRSANNCAHNRARTDEDGGPVARIARYPAFVVNPLAVIGISSRQRSVEPDP
jgi:hypothetical protein